MLRHDDTLVQLLPSSQLVFKRKRFVGVLLQHAAPASDIYVLDRLLEALAWLKWIATLSQWQRAAATAAWRGHLAFLKRMHQAGVLPRQWWVGAVVDAWHSLVNSLADRNCWHVLRWLHDVRVFDNIDLAQHHLGSAVDQGRTGALRWLLSLQMNLNPPLDAAMCETAAGSGNLGMLQLVYSLGCPLSSKSYLEANFHRSIEIVKWLHSQGCHPDLRTTCSLLARSNARVFCLGRCQPSCIHPGVSGKLECRELKVLQPWPVAVSAWQGLAML